MAGSSEPPLQLGAEVLGLLEKRRDRGDNLGCYADIVSVSGPGAHFAKAPPSRPIASQQSLGISGPDQICEGHPVDFVGRRCDFFEIPPEHFMAEFIGELEALDQSLPNLLIARFPLVAGEAFTKALHGVAERGGIELHPHLPVYVNRLAFGNQPGGGFTLSQRLSA